MINNHSDYDLIAIDLDGTLLDSEKNISKGAEKAIRDARKAGIRILIVTGRNLNTLDKIFTELDYQDYFIGSGGAYIGNPFTNDIISMNTIPISDAKELINISRHHPSFIFLENPQWMFVERLSKIHKKFRKIHNYNIKIVPDLEKCLNEEPSKIMFFADQEVLKKILQEIESKKLNLNIFPSSDGTIDITIGGITKGKALLKLLKHFNVNPDRVAVIGDNFNDLDMFHRVKIAIAMGNSPDAIKEAAEIIAPTNDNGGAAWAINKLVQGKGN